MTRPQIVRADTLDLQDKSSPTAADHSQNPHPAPLGIGPAAPHQEASLRRVEDERSDEEAALQNGWNAANASREDHDERTVAQDDKDSDGAAVRLNGGMSSEAEDAEMEDADADADADEDLDDLDRISSSPSISDGGYLLPSYSTWSEPRISPNPRSTPISSPTESVQECDSSSPYVDTPVHFPLAVSAARRSHHVPAGSAEENSPYCKIPIPFPTQPSKNKTQSADHHRSEYTWPRTTSGLTNNAPDSNGNVSFRSEHLTATERHLQDLRLDPEMSLMSKVDEAAVQAILLPSVPSPSSEVLDQSSTTQTNEIGLDTTNSDFDMEEHNGSDSSHSGSGSYADDNDSWVTDSDADSWDDELDHDDDSNDVSFSTDSRFVDSGWGGICLQDTEDIDFDFVYALHTFVATVEGQANATKGDTMVLLDDSNSYWWLVRVVKDSSIGYLPAEHIETPTERLARLNKHRNIDLSATMLGDTAEKTKNPLKKAIRRRHAKNVTWGDNSVVEASDYDYSSDEGGDDDDELFGGADPNQAEAQQQQAQGENMETAQDDNLKVQPLKVNGAARSKEDAEAKQSADNVANGEESKNSEESDDRPMDPKVSRNGTVRNTDSFFKDETTETRKITLTPNLLRDDSSTSTTGSRERGPSLESLEKNGFADKVKDDKKKKEKKPGMLSGLFKRKDKKTKGGADAHDSDNEKQSEEFGRDSPQSKQSEEMDRSSSEQAAVVQRQTSKGKLQKSHRSREDSPSKTKGILKTEVADAPVAHTPAPKEPAKEPTSQSTSTMRLVSPEQDDASKTTLEERTKSPETRARSTSSASKLNPINMLKTQQNGEPKPEKVKKAKQRVQLDDFDSEEEPQNNPFADPDRQTRSTKPGESGTSGRLSESPVHVSVADAQAPGKEIASEKGQEFDSQHPPGLTGDTSSQETNSPISTPTPEEASTTTASSNKKSLPAVQTTVSPSSTQQPITSLSPPSRPAPLPQRGIDTSPPDSSETTSLPAWSDQSLRNYLEDGSDIRDMLLVINDTTGVVPVGSDHPIMSQLFVAETKTVSGLSNELDSLLNGLLEKRMKKAAKGGSPSPITAKSSR